MLYEIYIFAKPFLLKITMFTLKMSRMIFVDPMFEGCYLDVADIWNKDLPEVRFTNTSMTVDLCILHCRAHGYKYAGVQVNNINYASTFVCLYIRCGL